MDVGSLLQLLEAYSLPQEETTILRGIQHDRLVEAVNSFIFHHGPLLGIRGWNDVTQGLRDAGLDSVWRCTCADTTSRLGIQVKSHGDLSTADDSFRRIVLSQIADSRRVNPERLLLVLGADLTNASQREKVRGISAEIQQMQDDYVITVCPEKVAGLWRWSERLNMDAINQMREAGYPWLTAVYDTCGNINQNSWGKGTGGEWSSTKRTVLHVGEGIGIYAIAMAENVDDVEFRFSVERSGRGFVTRRDWKRSPEWKWLVQESDIGRHVCVNVSIRRRKTYYQFEDADDYTYAIYDVLPARELVKPRVGVQEVTTTVPEQHAPAQSGLPPLLSGSAFVMEDVDERRRANHLGQAIAVLVNARTSQLEPKAEETLLDLFEQELERTRRYIQRSEEFRERKYGPSPILLGAHFGPTLPLLMDSTKAWLRGSLGKQPDWPELARLIQRQLDEYAHKDCRYDKRWWRAVERVCEKAHATQEESDPIGEILRIGDQCEGDRDKRVSVDVSSPKHCESEKQPNERGCAGEIPPVGSCAKRFKVALSFPGERRAFIEHVASHLASRLERDYVLYDKYHEAELARPDLDVYLPNLYCTQSELVAVFLCADYAKKPWCRLEWRSIRQMICTADAERIMFLSFDDIGPVPEIGILSGDGYVSIGGRLHQEIAGLILQRLKSNSARKD